MKKLEGDGEGGREEEKEGGSATPRENKKR